MNTTISLHQELLAHGRRMFDMGCPAEALKALRPLTRQADVRTHTLCEAYRLLGEIELEAGNERRARKHFAIAIGLVSDEASLYSLYAQAVDADPNSNPQCALKARRRAAKLDPRNAALWSALGWSHLRVNDREKARKAFRRALCLKPESMDTLAEIVEGMISMNRLFEARQTIANSRFRFPHEPALQTLSDRVEFEITRREQRMKLDLTDGASLLKFVPRPSTGKFADLPPAIIRADRRSLPAPHVLRLFGPKRAN